ncbi:hypothetical protein AX768_09190 [Burkholderia sp. PAMC 28687]|nr:hypothetical protein AX768_09190 [Burkholderia sp. PAMC 28687]
MIIKTCKACQKRKPASDYYSHPKTADLLRATCKNCFKQAQRDRYAADPQKVLASNKAWIARNYTYYRAQQTESKARAREKRQVG